MADSVELSEYARRVETEQRADRVAPLIDFARPYDTASAFLASRYRQAGHRTLHFWQGEFHAFAGSHYATVPPADMRERLYAWCAAGTTEPVRKRNVDELIDALRAAANLSDKLRPPSWLNAEAGDRDARGLIAVANGILDPHDCELLPATPRLFTTHALPFPYDDRAPKPHGWIDFLRSLWGDDDETIGLLQEWFGYCLCPRTEQQKALMLVGPKRGGKGTIGRILCALLGADNVCSPTLASLGSHFGLQPLIGKLLALVSDARLGGRADVFAVAENLLRITGEDAISIPRKHLPDYTATLPTRIVVLSNELPRFTDGSGALPSRFLVLTSAASFYGREDSGLTGRLLGELPGILNWALSGLDRLNDRGHFVQPEAARDAVAELETLAAPVKAFIADECAIEPGAEVAVATLFDAWRNWCRDNGRDHTGSQQTFGRDLRAALPHVTTVNRRTYSGARERYYSGVRLLGMVDRA